MSIITEIAGRIKSSVLARDSFQAGILKVALGEIQTFEARKGGIVECEAESIIRKIIAGIDEMVLTCEKYNRAIPANCEKERQILNSLLPKLMTIEEIKNVLLSMDSVLIEIKSASNDGQATGIAMKSLARSDNKASGKDVTIVVKELRS